MSQVDPSSMSARQKRAWLAKMLQSERRDGAIPIPLSEGQRAIWYIHELDPENSSLNLGEAVRVAGGLDRGAIEAAIDGLVRRHEVLRNRIVRLSGEPFQKLVNDQRVPLESLQCKAESEAALGTAAGGFVDRRFDLENGPPLRVATYHCDNGDDVLVFALHHIAGEFSSLVILIGELFEFYRAAIRKEPQRVDPISASYNDFVRIQAQYLRGPKAIADGEYWRAQLAEVNGPLELNGQSEHSDSIGPCLVSFQLTPGIARELRAFSRQLEVSAYVTLLSAFALLLSRRTGNRDLTIGAPMTGRTEARFANIVGYFDNPVPLRITVPVGASVQDFTAKVREAVLGAIEHQAYPLQRIVEDQRAQGRARGGSLFNTMFVMRQSPRREFSGFTAFGMGNSRARIALGGLLEVESIPLFRSRSQFHLALSVAEVDESLVGSWEYERKCFSEANIRNLSDSFVRLLVAYIANPHASIDSLDALSEAEETWLVQVCNSTAEDLGEDALLHEPFEAYAHRFPDTPALVTSGRTLTYGEVEGRANALARWLLDHGLQPTEHVAIVMEKGWEQIVSALGVLKAGGAYLPIDWNLPSERRNDLIRRGEAKLILVQERLRSRGVWPSDTLVVGVDTLGCLPQPVAGHAVRVDDLAYTIFTSGSTGVPKGVMIHHRGALNTLRDVNRRLAVGPGDSVLGLSALHFDLSVYDIFGVLGVGGRLILPDSERLFEPQHWVELVDGHQITLWNTVPSLLKLAVEHVERTGNGGLASLRAVMLSGDWIPTNLPARLRRLNPTHRFVSMGGATEGSVWSIWYEVDRVDPNWSSIPYGYPLANQSFHILNEVGQICPVGVPGNLHIGGTGVMMGYWRQPELSERALVTNPKIRGTLYRTGDLGRRWSNGAIEFLGRADFQVKIRGFRVEVGEIETVLCRHPRVSAAVVVAKKYGDENRLIAYVVKAAPVKDEELRSHVASKLPEYMIPALWVELESLPLTANGKVERKALPEPVISRTDNRSALRVPATREEKLVAEAVARTLQLDHVGMDDDLISLGADSVHIIRIAALLQDQGFAVTSRDLFETTNVGALARLLIQRYVSAGQQDAAPVLAAQRIATGPMATFSACELASFSALDPSRVSRAWRRLLACHQALRIKVELEQQVELDEVELEQRAKLRRHLNIETVLASLETEPSSTGVVLSLIEGHDEVSLLVAVAATLSDATGFRNLVSDLAQTLAQAEPEVLLPSPDRSYLRWARESFVDGPPLTGAAGSIESRPQERTEAKRMTTPLGALKEVCQRHRISLAELVVLALQRVAGPKLSAVSLVSRQSVSGGRRATPRVAPAAVERVIELKCTDPSDVLGCVAELRARQCSFDGVADVALVVTEATDVQACLCVGRLQSRIWRDQSVTMRRESIVLLIEQEAEVLTWSCWNESEAETDALLSKLRDELTTVSDVLKRIPAKISPQDFPLAELDESEVNRLMEQFPHLTDIWRLTPMQETMLLHGLIDETTGLYCHHLYWEARGVLELERLRAAIAKTLTDLPNLRVAFEHHAAKAPVQVVLPVAHVPLVVSTIDERDVDQTIRQIIADDRARGFDLRQPPLLRLTVLRLSQERSIIVLCHHHLLFDGWSVELLLERVLAAYSHASIVDRASGSFLDLVGWVQARPTDQYREYWRQLLDGADIPTPLGFEDRRIGESRAFLHVESEFCWDATFVRELEVAAQMLGVTAGVVLMTAWGLVLSRHAGRDDVIFGVTGAGRPESLPGASNIVGLCINTIPVRVKLEPNLTYGQVVREVQLQYAGSRQFEQTSLRELANFANRTTSHFKPFETIVIFENYSSQESWKSQSGDLEFGAPQFAEQTNTPLALYVLPGSNWTIRVSYDGTRFDRATIDALISQIRSCLAAIVRDSSRAIDGGHLVSAADLAFFAQVNQTSHSSWESGTITGLLALRASSNPNGIAIVDGERQLTYGELLFQARLVAGQLLARGVQPGDHVGILCPRSLELLVALYGVLEAGAAYVPLDDAAPAQRTAMVLQDAKVAVVLTSRASATQVPEGARTSLMVEEAITAGGLGRVAASTAPASAAYVIYTSGTTGKPKGVVVRHDAVVNYACAACELYGLTAHDRILQFYPASFDGAAEEIFGALASGAALVLRSEDCLSSMDGFLAYLERTMITVASIPTAIWHAWAGGIGEHTLRPPPAIRAVIIGGERALPVRVESWTRFVGRDGPRLFNTYGPTEATIVALVSELTDWNPEIEAGRETPIGRPVPNVVVYLLDQAGHLSPRGAPGELCIGGAGLAEGYLGCPELTAERFAEFLGAPGVRLYRTGDRARFRFDGQLEFLGRIDAQVKVRGYRVELGEIEASLAEHRDVRACVVDARALVGDHLSLVAYVVPAQQFASVEPSVLERQIRDFLRVTLPSYMIPSEFVLLENLPLNARGKVDRKALPNPKTSQAPGPIELPNTPLEREIARIWAEVLGKDQVSVDAEFFESGGHSLAALRLVGRLQQEVGLQLSLRELYAAPTIRGIAQQATRAQPDNIEDVKARMNEDARLALPALSVRATDPLGKPAVAFLTGATGFVGSAILGTLLASTALEVRCLVRSSDETAALRRIERSLREFGWWHEDAFHRVHAVMGDLDATNFGIDSNNYARLASTIDLVVHCGAKVTFAEPYEELRPANVIGTLEAIKLCSTGRRKALHYVSTLGVFDPMLHSEPIAEQWLAETCPELNSGYGQSKWVAERLVTRAIDAGLPGMVYRTGRVSGHSLTGAWKSEDLVLLMLDACVGLGMLPALDIVVDLTPIDYVANAIVGSIGDAGRVLHLVNPKQTSLREVAEILNDLGAKVASVPLSDWVDALRKHTRTDPKHPWSQLAVLLPQWHEAMRPPQHGGECYRSAATTQFLGEKGIACPRFGRNLMATYLRALRLRGIEESEPGD